MMLIANAALLAAQTPADTFHITEAAVADPSSSGWRVDPRMGRLSVSIPLALMPGEISFPVTLSMVGTPTSRSKLVASVHTTGGKNDHDVTTYAPVAKTSPIACELNVPRITTTVGGTRYVLEDGRVFYDSDFQKTTDAYNAHAGGPGAIFQAFGFAVPSARGCWAVSADASLISFDAPANYSFGSRYESAIKAHIPDSTVLYSCGLPATSNGGRSYFTTSISPYGYRVLMDRDRARIFAAFTYSSSRTDRTGSKASDYELTTTALEDGTFFIPIGIVDRFGHYVTLQWSTSGNLRRVDVRNQRGQGFTLRVNNTSSDLARLDFVGISAPSALVQGRQPLTEAPRITWDPESIGRPVAVTLGAPENIPQPSWSNAMGSPSAPPSTPDSSGSGVNRAWTFTYNDPNNPTVLASLTDPLGLCSTFQTQVYSIYQCWNQFESNTQPSTLPDGVTGVSRVDQVDTSGKSSVNRTITWARQIDTSGGIYRANAIRTTITDWWDTAVNQPDRSEVFSYGEVAMPGSALNNPTDTSCGFLNQWKLRSATGDEWTSLDRYSCTVKSAETSSRGGGLNGFLSVLSYTKKTRQGELPRQERYSYTDGAGLQVASAAISVCPSGGSAWAQVGDRAYAYNNQWSMLETQQVNQITTTRFDSTTGSALPAVKTVTNTWDNSNLLQLMATYQNAGNLRHGSTYTYDGGGRVATEGVFHMEYGTQFASPNSIARTYDDAVTGLPTAWTTSYQDGSSTGTLTRTQGDFDCGFRPQTLVDEKGVTSKLTYDLYGRALTLAKDGEAAISYSYPDEWTRITTQAGKTTTETFDGFGRLIKKVLPNGNWVVPTYDLHSRVVQTAETSTEGTRTSKATYDLLDRKTSETSITGKLVEYTYGTDGTNNVVTQSVRHHNAVLPGVLDLAGDLVTITKTDAFGQVVSVTAPNGDVTSFLYDGQGNKTSVSITPKGGGPGTSQVRTFTYDGLGRLISKQEPETGTQTFSNFMALNQAQTLTEVGTGKDPLNPNAQRIRTLSYDGLGRLRSQINGSTAECFVYQGAFLTRTIRTLGNDMVTQTFAYDGAGKRLSQESTNSQVTGLW